MGSKLSKHHRSKPAVSLPHLPIELVLMICNHLKMDPVSSCSLAITCRSLFSILIHHERFPSLDKEHKNTFLCLLEGDIGNKYYLCGSCTRLHRFEKSWGPTSPDSHRRCQTIYAAGHVPRYDLDYHHVRLVMNHYRSGGATGIPLKNLNQTVFTTKSPTARYSGIWRQDWSARIISNQLFLSARHTFQSRDEREFRQTLDSGSGRICSHIGTAPPRTGEPSPLPLDPLPLRPGKLEACWKLPGSCRRCLTDYILTIETPQACAKQLWRGKWRISITTYHQVGDGTSLWDWNRLAFRNWPYAHPKRDPEEYPPGIFKETWKCRRR